MKDKTSKKVKLFAAGALVTLFTLGTAAVSEAKEKCYKLYCIDNYRDGSDFKFKIRNTQTHDITVRVEFSEIENLESSQDLPYVVTIPAKSTDNDLILQRVDPSLKTNYRYKTWSNKGSADAEHDDEYVYYLPYESGKGFLVSQGFNGKFSHHGEQKYAIDWRMPVGTPVLAAREGTVVGVESRFNVGGADKSFADKANYVYIQHEDGTLGAYLHLKQNGVKVKVGQEVEAGELLGYSGNTGWSGAPHLHFWVYKVAPDGKTRISFPIRFVTEDDDGAVLQQGKTYTAPEYGEEE